MRREFLIAFVLSAALGADARTVRSDQDLKFYQITSYDRPPQYLGFTSSKLDNFVKVPAGENWFVRPDGRMTNESYGLLFEEIEKKRYPGLDVSNRWDVTNTIFEAVGAMESLKILRFSNTKISNTGLHVLEQMSQLKVLVLNNQINNTGLKSIRNLKRLEALEMRRTKVTDSGLDVLKELPKLEMLDVGETRITDAGAKSIASLKSLRQLDISGTEITDRGTAMVARLPKLEILYANDLMTDRGLKALAEAKQLKVLDLSGAPITDSGLRHLRGHPRLEALALSDTRVSDAGMESIATLKNLKTLELTGTGVSRDGLLALAAMPKLETLSLGWEELTGLELRALGNLPKLKRLVLNDRTVGDEVLQRIRVMAKKSRNVVSPVAVQRTSDGALHRREVAGVAPAKHPGWKPMGSPSRTLDDKSAPGPKATYDVASLPKDLPQTPIVKQPAVASSTPQGEGMMLEFGAKPSGERSSRRRLTGLKRLHQLELTQGARDLDLQPGASANIKSFEATESNSLGEITINAR